MWCVLGGGRGHTKEGASVHSSPGAVRPVLLCSSSLLLLKLTHLINIQPVNGDNAVPNSCKNLLQNWKMWTLEIVCHRGNLDFQETRILTTIPKLTT